MSGPILEKETRKVQEPDTQRWMGGRGLQMPMEDGRCAHAPHTSSACPRTCESAPHCLAMERRPSTVSPPSIISLYFFYYGI